MHNGKITHKIKIYYIIAHACVLRCICGPGRPGSTCSHFSRVSAFIDLAIIHLSLQIDLDALDAQCMNNNCHNNDQCVFNILFCDIYLIIIILPQE